MNQETRNARKCLWSWFWLAAVFRNTVVPIVVNLTVELPNLSKWRISIFSFFFFLFFAVNKNVQTLLEKLTLTFIQIKVSSYLFYYSHIISLRLLVYSIFRYTLQASYCNIGILHRRKTVSLGLLFKLEGWNN